MSPTSPSRTSSLPFARQSFNEKELIRSSFVPYSLLFACHATNATAQLIQTGRFVNYWYRGGESLSFSLSLLLVLLRLSRNGAMNRFLLPPSFPLFALLTCSSFFLRYDALGHEEAEAKAALVNSSATLTELKKLPSSLSTDAEKLASSASSTLLDTKAATEAALAQATAQAEAAFSKTKDEGVSMLQDVQSGLDAAKAHVVAGGKDALRRGEEVVEEGKRELGVGKQEVEKVVEKKKGWLW